MNGFTAGIIAGIIGWLIIVWLTSIYLKAHREAREEMGERPYSKTELETMIEALTLGIQIAESTLEKVSSPDTTQEDQQPIEDHITTMKMRRKELQRALYWITGEYDIEPMEESEYKPFDFIQMNKLPHRWKDGL